MIENTPLLFVVSVPRELSPLNSSTVLPNSAVPSIVGVELFVSDVVVVITGASGGVMSIVIESGVDEAEILPKESVDVTVIELRPSLSGDEGVIEKFPSSSARKVSPVLVPLTDKVIVLPDSAVPVIKGVVSAVKSTSVDRDGASGAVVSIVNANAVEANEVFPATSVDLIVRL